MEKKLLCLSAAAHQYDNPTECPNACGENVHCRAYMDIVERRMKEIPGVEVMRPLPDAVGEEAMYGRVAEANQRGADLYYVGHTNATGQEDAKVHRSCTLCWNDKTSKEKAAVIGKYRKHLPHKVVERPDLYEIRATKMTTLYDELFFHDNPDDCAWFHNGGMEIMAEETVQALCELLEVEYVAPVKEEPKQETTVEKPAEDAAEETVVGDYKERMAQEYRELKERYEKLHRIIVKYEAGTLEFTPSCPIGLLKAQAKAMGEYLYALEVRAEIEGITL